ncbi:MAG: carbohydrate binding family 9 domain-containing protein [Saprospiraceae bacterium]|nr:carbohydrate binding family 9 domain-containing protein [Saprospiraceae bacterium]
MYQHHYAHLATCSRNSLMIVLFIGCLFNAFGQTSFSNEGQLMDEKSDIRIMRTKDKITIDGALTEAAWYTGVPAINFWQNFPSDSVLAEHQTEIYFTYDDQQLYVGVKCYSNDRGFVIPSLRRDYLFSGNDNISILFDTYNDETNAFLFGMNPYGVRREALIANGGRMRQDFAESWDNKWSGQAKIYKDHWIAEFAIPFKTLRFQKGDIQWRFNSYRYDTQVNEISSWYRIPQNQIIMDLGHMGNMIWDEPLGKPGSNFSVIPYATAGSFRDFENPLQANAQWNTGIGADAKIGVTSGLNLDLTINPDFSQVEVDDQVINLDRFEIRLPEKRQFFLENADLFSSFGNRRVNPFFSRRIGVSIDSMTGQNVQNKILYGARLSGKLNDNLRIGFLNMQAEKQSQSGLPGFNYTVTTLQQQVFSRSNLAFMFVNKQATRAESSSGDFHSFNRMLGFEYRLATPDNKWTGKLFYHQLFSPVEVEDKYTYSFQVQYLKYRYRLELAQLFIGEGFDAELGFVPRRDIMSISPEVQLFFYPKNHWLNNHDIALDYRHIYKAGADGNTLLPKYGLSDRELEAEWSFEFADNSRGSAEFNHTYVFLLNDFDPTRSQEEVIYLPAGSAYTYNSLSLSYRSDRRKKMSFEVTPTFGQFFNGSRLGLEGSLTYRYQPLGFVSIDYGINHLKLAAPFRPANVWLVGPRVDLTFTKSIFLTTFVQYNSQFDNLNINTRFQWRFQPVSDFFLVYTDNYLTDPFSQFSSRNRSLVAKVTYWLNL